MSPRNHNLTDRLLRTLLGLCLLITASTGQAIERVTFYHNDALGSPVAATDANGTLLWRESYAPYGKRLSQEAGSKHTVWYTGKPEEAALGLSYFGARWYDPAIGRFLAMDPAGFDPDNIHSFGRYAYANDNPYAYVDPDGRENASPWQFFGLGGGPGGYNGLGGFPRIGAGGGVPRSGRGATGTNAANSGKQFWTNSTTFQGNKVYQRNDLIDPKLLDARGRSNLDRMQKGLAPIGPDGKPINLHHMTQGQRGGIAETTQTFHQQNSRTIHTNPSSTPSGIDRGTYNRWRSKYWKSRANDFKE